MTWCRDDVRIVNGVVRATNHHPRCEYVDESLIDVWRVALCGTSYLTDEKPDKEENCGVTVTAERMHREIYENLPEFRGF